MISEQDYKRLYWASRRGMLELDLMLVPFVEQRFRELSPRDQQRYIHLLEQEDNQLYAWLLGRDLPDDEAIRAIVQQVIDFAKGRDPG